MNETILKDQYDDIMKYTTYFARKYNSLSKEEIISELNFSIAKAYITYDDTKKVKFSSYALTIMHNQCKQIIRDRYQRLALLNASSLDDIIQEQGETYYNFHYEEDYFTSDEYLLISFLHDFSRTRLTKTQRQVFDLFLKGYNNMDICNELNVTHSAVTRIRNRIIDKMLPTIYRDFPFLLDREFVRRRLKEVKKMHLS